MSFAARFGMQFGLGLLLLFGVSGCERKAATERKQAPSVPSAPSVAPAAGKPTVTTPDVVFEKLDPTALLTRGSPSGLESRFSARPAVVASPCGFHLVVSESERAWTTLLVGHELAWTKEDTALLLQLDGITIDVGIIDDKTMGALTPQSPDRLLQLTGQWETTWLSRDAGVERLPVKENARGQAHLEPHPAWRVWSTNLGDHKTSAGARATHAIIATVALDQRVLVLRALLDGDKLALRALRRLVFAVDSIEARSSPLGRRDFTETLKKAALADPTCAAIHTTHDSQLE